MDTVWKLVPVEPTPEMRKAFFSANDRIESADALANLQGSPDFQWRKMLEAAPSPPASPAEGVVAIKALEWVFCDEQDGDFSWSASTPFGSYYIRKRHFSELTWGYCFDEYYDEDNFFCEDVEAGKAAAWANWQARLEGVFTPPADLAAIVAERDDWRGVYHDMVEVSNAWRARAETAEAALAEARAAFSVDYADDGRVAAVSHGSEALRSLVVMLDAALTQPATTAGER